MKPHDMVRLAGPLAGVAGALLVFAVLGGVAGLAVAAAIFLICCAISESWWRRRASREEIRQDLERRVRDGIP